MCSFDIKENEMNKDEKKAVTKATDKKLINIQRKKLKKVRINIF
jgi:hypothetical protein